MVGLLSPGTLPETPDLKNFATILSVEMCYQLSSGKLDAHSVTNWTVVTSELRQSTAAVYHVIVKLCWRRGGVRRMNEVNPRRARLVLGWLTVFGRVGLYHLGM